MLDVRYSHLYFYQSLNRLQRGLSAIAELLVLCTCMYCTAPLSPRKGRLISFHDDDDDDSGVHAAAAAAATATAISTITT